MDRGGTHHLSPYHSERQHALFTLACTQPQLINRLFCSEWLWEDPQSVSEEGALLCSGLFCFSNDSVAGSSQQVIGQSQEPWLPFDFVKDLLPDTEKLVFSFVSPSSVVCQVCLRLCSLEHCLFLTLYSGKPTYLFNEIVIPNKQELLRRRGKRLLIHLINELNTAQTWNWN